MIYQVVANLYFHEQDEANDFYYDCQLALAKSDVFNPDQADKEYGYIHLIANHHDETPTAPCELLRENNNLPSR